MSHILKSQPRTRRLALQTAAALLAATLQPLTLAQAPGPKLLTAEQDSGAVLAKVLYLLAPNLRFSAAQYQRQVDVLQKRIASDALLRVRLMQGIDKLNSLGEKPFMQLAEDAQRDALRKQVGSPFWNVMSNPAVGIYNNPDIWPLIGYEGPAFEKGGYLFRGVNDIAWLPK